MSWLQSIFLGFGAFATSASRIFMPKETTSSGDKPSPQPGTPKTVIEKYGLWFAAGAFLLIILLLLFSRRK